MVTVAFSELRQNLTQVAEKVANEGEEVVVFKRSKPLFKIVPLDYQGPVAVEYDAAQERGAQSRRAARTSPSATWVRCGIPRSPGRRFARCSRRMRTTRSISISWLKCQRERRSIR